MTLRCFSNIEVRTLGRPVHDWLCSTLCFSIYVGFYCSDYVFEIIAMLVDQNLTVLFCFLNLINFDKILNTTISNATPNYERASTILYRLLHTVSVVHLSWPYWWFWIHLSLRLFATDFQCNSFGIPQPFLPVSRKDGFLAAILPLRPLLIL